MKKTVAVLAVAAVCMILPAAGARGESTTTVSGKSGAFSIDTRNREFVIADVKSDFCSGAYGMKGGSRATFLSGVKANVDFTVTMRGGDVKLKRIEVQGKQFTGNKFTFNVGSLGVGESLKVVAYGDLGGEEVVSKPFRVNCDVASQPSPAYRVAGPSHDGAIWYASPELSTITILDSIEEAFGLAGEDVSFKFKPAVQALALVDSKSGQWKTGVEWGGQVKLWESETGLADYVKAYKAIKKQSLGWIAGVDLAVTLSGEAVAKWNPVRRSWAGHSSTMGLRVAAKYEAEWPIPQTLCLVRLKGGIRTDVTVRPGIKSDGSFFGELNLSPLFSLYGGVRAGVPLIWAEGLGGGDIALYGVFPKQGGRYIQTIKGALWVDGKWQVFMWGNWKDPESLHHEWPYYFRGGPRNVLAASSTKPTMLDDEWHLIPRDYAVEGPESDAQGWPKTRQSSPLAMSPTGGYPFPAPSVARGGSADAIAYLRDDGSRTDADRTEVVFGRGAESVWNDGTADFDPSLSVSGNGTAVLAWMNSKRAWGQQAPAFSEICKAMELAVAVRKGTSGKWVAKNLTDDTALDASPVAIAAGDGTAMVAWRRNAAGTPFGSAEEPTSVMASRWNGNAWSAPVAVATGLGMLAGLDLTYDGTNACAVWTYDGDGNAETAGDMAVGAAVWKSGKWGSVKVMADGLSSATPVVAGTGMAGAPRCAWNDNGVMVERSADGSAAATPMTMAWNGRIPGDARAVHGSDGAVALAWAEEDGGATAPVVMVYDAGMGSWGGPVAIAEAETGRMARAVSASVGTNGVLTAWESVAVTTNASGETQFGATELRVESVGATANPGVKADGFAFEDYEVIAGDVTGVKVTVRNTGLKAVSNAALRVWVGDGDATEAAGGTELFGEGDKPVVLDLPGGAEVEASVRWLAVDSMSNLTFVARIEPPTGTMDADADDNEASWRPGTALLSLENARCEVVGVADRLLTATVRNTGLARAEAGTAVAFRLDSPDGRELGRDVAGALRAGSTHGYDAGIAWNMAGGTWTGTWVTVYAVIDTGNAEADASKAVPILVMTPRDRDGDGLLDGEEEAMGTDPNKPDTNGDGTNDYEHVYVYFTDPLAGMELAYTTTTPVPVPHAWLDGYADALASHAGDYEAFAWDTAANGTNRVWECYVAGTDPTDGNEAFRAVLSFQGGKPLVGPRPDLSVDGTRVYRVEGKKSVEDKNWEDVTDKNDWDGEGWRLFRMKVEMAK